LTLPTLFETFNDLEDVRASKYGRMGLGLPLNHKLRGLLRATLGVRSTPGGTTVTIELPRGSTESNQSDPPIADLAQAA